MPEPDGAWCVTPADPVLFHYFRHRKSDPPALLITAVCGIRPRVRRRVDSFDTFPARAYCLLCREGTTPA